jgi:hypothetical protein
MDAARRFLEALLEVCAASSPSQRRERLGEGEQERGRSRVMITHVLNEGVMASRFPATLAQTGLCNHVIVTLTVPRGGVGWEGPRRNSGGEEMGDCWPIFVFPSSRSVRTPRHDDAHEVSTKKSTLQVPAPPQPPPASRPNPTPG